MLHRCQNSCWTISEQHTTQKDCTLKAIFMRLWVLICNVQHKMYRVESCFLRFFIISCHSWREIWSENISDDLWHLSGTWVLPKWFVWTFIRLHKSLTYVVWDNAQCAVKYTEVFVDQQLWNQLTLGDYQAERLRSPPPHIQVVQVCGAHISIPSRDHWITIEHACCVKGTDMSRFRLLAAWDHR